MSDTAAKVIVRSIQQWNVRFFRGHESRGSDSLDENEALDAEREPSSSDGNTRVRIAQRIQWQNEVPAETRNISLDKQLSVTIADSSWQIIAGSQGNSSSSKTAATSAPIRRKASRVFQPNKDKKQSNDDGDRGQGEDHGSENEQPYDDGGYVEAAENCRVCGEPLKDPIQTYPCKHKFCRVCWLYWSSNGPLLSTVKCPRCNGQVIRVV